MDKRTKSYMIYGLSRGGLAFGGELEDKRGQRDTLVERGP